jgi:pSer/pThr/pTyr-binding forkhead associated (FHA) protein
MSVLYILDPPRMSAALSLVDRVVSVGRDPDNGLVLADPSVSRFHFILYRHGSDYLIEDAGSRYGAFINGRRLTHRAVLHSGSCIAAGTRHLLYRGNQEASAYQTRRRESFGIRF